MKKSLPSSILFVFLLGSTLILPACAPAARGGASLGLDQAYKTAGIMPVKPYTRTIFSSTDF